MEEAQFKDAEDGQLKLAPAASSFFDRPINVSLILAALVVLALLLGWPTLHMGLWLDECITVHSVAVPDVQTLIATMYGRMDDLHPPLSYLLLFAFMHLFGNSDVVVRMPAFLCGLLLIPCMFWLGKTIGSKPLGLLAAFFAAVSPFGNYMICQSRPYAMATLIAAVCLTFYCQLVDNSTKRKKVAFTGFVFSAAALCYADYASCPLLPALGVAAVLIYLHDRLTGIEGTQAAATFIRCVAALFLGCVLFLPWVPSVIKQSHFGPNMDPTPLSIWPQVFTYNLGLATLPLPMIVGTPLVQLVLSCSIIYAAVNWKKVGPMLQPGRLKLWVISLPSAYIVMLCALLLPSCVIGYITPFWPGYLRYIFSYSPAGWILLAAFMLKVFQFWGKGSRTRVLVPVTLVAVLLVNIVYLCWFDSRPQSGLRTVARDAIKGAYDDCAILIAPDVIGPTLGFYLSAEERAAHHILVCGFPRWNDTFTPPTIPSLPGLWGPPEIVQNTETRIADLPRQGWKRLALAKDSDEILRSMSTKEVPKGPRVWELKDDIDHKYKKLSDKHYDGVTESVTVSVYQLAP